MGKRGPKPRRRCREYTKEHKDYILMLRATGLSYEQIPPRFNDKFGWEPSKSVVSRIINEVREAVKAMERNGTPLEQNGTSETPHGGTVPEHVKKKAIDTIEVRTYLVVQMVNLIRADTVDGRPVNADRSNVMSADERIKRLRELVPNVFKGLDGIDAAERVATSLTVNTQGGPVHVGDSINLNSIDLSNVDPDTLRGLLPWFRSAFCEGCPLKRKDVIDIKESDEK